MKELKGWDLTVFSYGHCPFCGADIIIPDSDDVTTCGVCGAVFYLSFDENGLLKAVYYENSEEVDSDDSIE
jgi:ribosomal protein S27AE